MSDDGLQIDLDALEASLRDVVPPKASASAPQAPPQAPQQVETLAMLVGRLIELHNALSTMGAAAAKVADRVSGVPVTHALPEKPPEALGQGAIVSGAHAVLDAIKPLIYSISDSLNRIDITVG